MTVIDDDLGKSGQSIEGRPGFQRLLAEVALDRIGLILGLEMSRRARSCKDGHQLLELCARFRVLLADADGVFDPTDHSDRLLLGLHGMMNEAELHVLKQRMHQGKLNKARRGELIVSVPVGYLKHPSGQVTLDPDEQAQGVVRLIFDEFDRQGTVHGILRHLIAHGIRLPVRSTAGGSGGPLQWRPPGRETIRQILRHPIYAGAYRYGHRPTDPRRQTAGHPKSGRNSGLAADECLVFLRDRFPAYISWERFEANQLRLAANRSRAGSPGAIRNGTALLAGVVRCGRCGKRMYVRYTRTGRPSYVCSTLRSDYGLPLCQSTPAADIETWVAEQVLSALQPAALDASLTAAAAVEEQRRQLVRHWEQRIERARYEADRAGRQYHACEPENRLVARTLEQRWDELGTRKVIIIPAANLVRRYRGTIFRVRHRVSRVSRPLSFGVARDECLSCRSHTAARLRAFCRSTSWFGQIPEPRPHRPTVRRSSGFPRCPSNVRSRCTCCGTAGNRPAESATPGPAQTAPSASKTVCVDCEARGRCPG
nr:recombinase family protein [Fimbriiglobus ruber]